MNIIVFDTETTGLPKDRFSEDPADHPHVCQFASVTLEYDPDAPEKGLVPTRKLEKLIRPPVHIEEGATAVHGITDEMVADAPPFGAVVDEIMVEFHGIAIAVAHNGEFDKGVMEAELRRISRPHEFLPARVFDTMKETRDLCQLPSTKGPGFKNPKLQELHQYLFGTQFENAHQAMGDVSATVKCLQELYRRGIFAI